MHRYLPRRFVTNFNIDTSATEWMSIDGPCIRSEHHKTRESKQADCLVILDGWHSPGHAHGGSASELGPSSLTDTTLIPGKVA
jgi:hypothetical protein